LRPPPRCPPLSAPTVPSAAPPPATTSPFFFFLKCGITVQRLCSATSRLAILNPPPFPSFFPQWIHTASLCGLSDFLPGSTERPSLFFVKILLPTALRSQPSPPLHRRKVSTGFLFFPGLAQTNRPCLVHPPFSTNKEGYQRRFPLSIGEKADFAFFFYESPPGPNPQS